MYRVTLQKRLLNVITRQVRMNSETALNMRTDGPISQSIRGKVIEKFPDLTHFQVYNDSYKHKGHQPMQTASNTTESHMRLEIVTDEFKGMNLPKRHRLIYSLLQQEFDEMGLHALQLTTKTPEEFARSKETAQAKSCKD
ncbi:hypothetical protein RNJ44_02574 [Nakaseomyces bracarensis]|uniref:BolA-like protein n=1 Tax=Nakaseomyces bracarensis TaxID=273131 RepID=A0ABR4NM34_9SACH